MVTLMQTSILERKSLCWTSANRQCSCFWVRTRSSSPSAKYMLLSTFRYRMLTKEIDDGVMIPTFRGTSDLDPERGRCLLGSRFYVAGPEYQY